MVKKYSTLKHALLASGLLLALFLSPDNAKAQNASVEKKVSGHTNTTSVTPLRQGFIMRNGKVMTIQPKGYAPMAQSKTFPNGSVLQPTGKLTVTGGEVLQLNEGDRLDLQGTLTRSPVVIQRSSNVSGDTTGLGKYLLQAQQMTERLKLLQEKQRVLQLKNETLEKTVQEKPDQAKLKKLDADIAKLKQQIAAQDQKE